ncbi:hypothetical protein E2C01_078353 [Portunus trituberculatus]|uniref:Uncharacterized protein n=1 Tax=Portunus trituberculatus TaxID=210409 RepID=A0A5B7INM4_PORTR|nr:hypothetical protein [Portunus trituberculatus]
MIPEDLRLELIGRGESDIKIPRGKYPANTPRSNRSKGEVEKKAKSEARTRTRTQTRTRRRG